MNPVRLSLISHTNVGKTTLARTLVKRDVEEKANLVVGNDRAKDAPALALRAKILNLISGDEGETLGVLANRLRGFKKPDVEKCLEAMVADGTANVSESVHKFTKRVIKRYQAAP